MYCQHKWILIFVIFADLNVLEKIFKEGQVASIKLLTKYNIWHKRIRYPIASVGLQLAKH